jgi:hypothetical protein
MDQAQKRGVLWADLCKDGAYRGRWVALEGVRYDSGAPMEGVVVDADDDLATLCTRVQASDYAGCAILFCDDKSSGIRRASVA